MSLWNHSPSATYGYQLWKQPSLNNNNNGEGNENVFSKKAIRHMHFSHNTPCLPPKFCITFNFHFSWVLQPSRIKVGEPLERGYSFLISKISNR